MIARPVNRPQPIPFGSPAPASGASATRPVSWAASSGPAVQGMVSLGGNPQPASPARVAFGGHATPPQHGVGSGLMATRLSPVKTAAYAGTSKAATPCYPLKPVPAMPDQTPHHAASSTSSQGDTPRAPAPGEPSAKFVGQGSLSVRSSVTGRHYRFQGHGDCIRIDKLDATLLRRINDLIVN